jgi:hypothetical protein
MADDKKLAEMRKRRERASEAVSTLYDKASDDIKFVTKPGEQWDEKTKAARGGRPCYEFPKLQGQVRQVVNAQRQARPQGKVRGVEEGDQGLAELMQGICRNIESVSNADMAYDIAFEAAVKGGFGAWRIKTDYRNPDDFDLDIIVEPIFNQFSVLFDSSAVMRDRRDANYAFIEESMSEDDFDRQFPKADKSGFADDGDCKNWRDAGKIRVVEYWWKEPIKTEILALSNGDVVDAEDTDEAELAKAGISVTRRRNIDSHKVMSVLTNGHEFLTDPTEFPSKFIPIIPVWGNISNIDGEDYWQGIVREAKDSQRLHNVHRTAMIEAVAKAPKAPYILKMKWIKGLEQYWKRANSDDFPYLPVHDTAEELPKRADQAQVPTALIQMAGMDADDMKAATGIYDASLGARSNETSGRAIGQRKEQGAVATFHYSDNLSYAIRYEYEIFVDMIPRVYDTPRVVRILGADGGEKWKKLYQEVQDENGNTVTVNDISKGKYDVAITVGPSYATQRMEAVDTFAQLAGQIGSSFPAIGPLLAYQVVSNLDLPGSEEVTTALRKQLVGQGLMEPKEGEQPPAPPPPDPRIEAAAMKMHAEGARAAADAARTQAEIPTIGPKAQADISKTQAEAEKTTFEAGSTHLTNVTTAANLVPHPLPQPIPPEGWQLNSDITGY